MSLVLRKLAQPILNSEGLDDFHTQIEKNTKCIQIVGECGKPLFNISGITFARTVPGRDEINYAVELLEEFFIKHKIKVKEYFKAKEVYQKTILPKQTEVLRLNYGRGGDIPLDAIVTVFVRDNKEISVEKLAYNPEKKTFTYNCNDVAFSVIGQVAKNKKLLTEMKDKAKEVEIFLESRKVYFEVLRSLQTCEI